MMILWQSNSKDSSSRDSVCVFSHYDPNNKVEDYVLNYLSQLHRHGFLVIFVTTSSSIDTNSVEKLKSHVSTLIIRENTGYDFGSYKTGIEYALSTLTPKKILVTNDSVFGPLSSLERIFLNADKFDIYGITDSYDHNYHIQSYFILYNERAIKHRAFSDFWNSVELLDGRKAELKRQIIFKYEIGGTQHFIENGLSVGAEFEFISLIRIVFDEFIVALRDSKQNTHTTVPPLNLNYNATHRYWRELITSGCPFLKRELLLSNPTNAPLSDWADVISSNSSFDVNSILSALRSYSGNDNFFYITPPKVIANSMNSEGFVTLPVAESLKRYQNQNNIANKRKFKFNEEIYLSLYPDVNVAVMDGVIQSGLHHFKLFGADEGRNPCLEMVIDH